MAGKKTPPSKSPPKDSSPSVTKKPRKNIFKFRKDFVPLTSAKSAGNRVHVWKTQAADQAIIIVYCQKAKAGGEASYTPHLFGGMEKGEITVPEEDIKFIG